MPHAHVVTSTTHKTLGGPRGGVILTNDATLAKKINSAVFPGQQGGPLEHVIAAKAVAFKLAAEPEFRERQQRTLDGAQILAERLLQPTTRRAAGINVVTGGTDVHLVLVDLRDSPNSTASRPRTGCTPIGITVNRNAVPFDPRPPMVTSGLRIGTPALADPRLRRRRLHRGRRHHRLRRCGPTLDDDQSSAALRARVDRLAAAVPALPGPRRRPRR